MPARPDVYSSQPSDLANTTSAAAIRPKQTTTVIVKDNATTALILALLTFARTRAVGVEPPNRGQSFERQQHGVRNGLTSSARVRRR